MFVCDKNFSCCDHAYWDSWECVEDEAKECGHLVEVAYVRHGKWKLNKDGSGTCDQCNFTQKNVWDFDSWQNFCGHCGADMRSQ